MIVHNPTEMENQPMPPSTPNGTNGSTGNDTPELTAPEASTGTISTGDDSYRAVLSGTWTEKQGGIHQLYVQDRNGVLLTQLPRVAFGPEFSLTACHALSLSNGLTVRVHDYAGSIVMFTASTPEAIQRLQNTIADHDKFFASFSAALVKDYKEVNPDPSEVIDQSNMPGRYTEDFQISTWELGGLTQLVKNTTTASDFDRHTAHIFACN